jgi:hypothetical protein
VAAEHARGREFTQTVPNHIFGHINRNVPPAIMNCDGVTHHLWEDHAVATPGAQNFLSPLVFMFSILFISLGSTTALFNDRILSSSFAF